MSTMDTSNARNTPPTTAELPPASSVTTETLAENQKQKRISKPPFAKTVIPNYKLNLSAVYHDHDRHKLVRPKDLGDLIKIDLDVQRIEAVQSWLSICGAKIAARPLTSLKGYYERRLIASDRADLHLCWDPTSLVMYLKPLPAYLLDVNVWQTDICADGNEVIYKNALGFLRTYVQLIPEEADFYCAIAEGLLPRKYAIMADGEEEAKDLTWTAWSGLVGEFVASLEDMNRHKGGDILNRTPEVLMRTRWEYSELRLSRLSLAYRLSLISVLRGFTFSYFSYGHFLSRNSNWLIAAFAYVAIVHGAMQVGLGTPQLEENATFVNASYGFAVFSIIAPVGILALLLLWMFLMMIDNILHWLFRFVFGDKRQNKPGDLETLSPDLPATGAVATAAGNGP